MMFASSAYTQNPEIEFKEKEHKFGQIKEEDGVAYCVFEFTNTGLAPLVISGVSASCGCTTPKWTKEPIPAGGTGSIDVAYNAKGRPGSFKKSITVRSNASESTVVLYISGEVIPRPKTVSDEYPMQVGIVRLKSKMLPFIDVYKNTSKTNRFEIVNTSNEEVKLSFDGVPKHVVLEYPTFLKAQEKGTVVVTYNAKDIDDYGNRTDAVYLVLNGKQELTEDYKLTINSNIREDFSKLTAGQKENAPVADFQSKSLSVDLKKGEKKQFTIGVTNAGKSPLLIRKLKRDKGVSKAELPKSIAPGKTAQLKIEVNTADLTDNVFSKITVITNDPKNPVTTIAVNIRLRD